MHTTDPESMTVKSLTRFVPRAGMKILVIGDNHQWATDDSGKAAYASCGKPRRWVAYEVHPDIWVDSFGSIRFDRLSEKDQNLPDDRVAKILGARH